MINATLILQIIHFGIACFAVDRLILRTAVSQIRDEKKKADRQAKRIEDSQEQIFLLNQEKEIAWRSVQERLKALIPEYKRYGIIQHVQPREEVSLISKQKVAAYQNEIAHEIIERVEHVH